MFRRRPRGRVVLAQEPSRAAHRCTLTWTTARTVSLLTLPGGAVTGVNSARYWRR